MASNLDARLIASIRVRVTGDSLDFSIRRAMGGVIYAITAGYPAFGPVVVPRIEHTD